MRESNNRLLLSKKDMGSPSDVVRSIIKIRAFCEMACEDGAPHSE